MCANLLRLPPPVEQRKGLGGRLFTMSENFLEGMDDAYRRFLHSLLCFPKLTILPFDDEGANRFTELQNQRIRTGTMDLKIACIAMEHDAVLLTRNRTDFEKVPGLLFENRLD